MIPPARLGGGPEWLLVIPHYGVLFFLDIADLQARDGGDRGDVPLGGVKKLMAPIVAKTMWSEVAALAELKRVLESRS